MNVSIEQVRAFLVVSRLGSFTKAARILNISQPGLTVQIRLLEEQLKFRLLDRNTRHVELTRAGRDLIPAFQRIVQDFDAIIDNVRDIGSKRQGIIRLACLPSVASTHLPKVIAAFKKKHPQVSYILRDAMGKRIIEMIRSEEVDIGIADGEPNWPDLESIELMRDHLHVIFPKTHRIAKQEKITLESVIKYPLVLMDPAASTRTMLDAAFAHMGRLVMPVCEVTYISTAIGMVSAGLGLAILSSLSIKAASLKSYPSLQSRAIQDESLTRSISLIRKKGRTLSPAVEEFVKMLAGSDLAKNLTRGSASSAPPKRSMSRYVAT
jgi:DNA-binding transcriptional LysR family regulator